MDQETRRLMAGFHQQEQMPDMDMVLGQSRAVERDHPTIDSHNSSMVVVWTG
jgi:hypothetical protein